MKELEKMLQNLCNEYTAKESEINNSGYTPSSYILSEMQNRKNDIDSFELSMKNVSTHPLIKAKIIVDFGKKAKNLSEAISNTKVEKTI